MDAIPSVGPFVGEAPEDRHAERIVGEMLTYLDDFAATVEPQLLAAMGAHIPGSVKGQERFLARLRAVPSPAIINVAAVFGKRCRFAILLSLWEKDEFGGANVVFCTASADGPGTEKRDSIVRWRISKHALVRLVQRSQAHDAVKLLSVMRIMAKAVILGLADSGLVEDKPGVLKVPFTGGIAVLELPEPGALITVKTILPPALEVAPPMAPSS
ncbi:MAG TPA: hypothetical protein VNY10_21345 [Roseiarcus sp.]|nr:hypothetical protein [Roseiarcus sp.]